MIKKVEYHNINQAKRIIRAVPIIMASFCIALPVNAQDAQQEEDGIVRIAPLFEYTVAPEELPDLQSKSDYVVSNFWDQMDFNAGKAVDQNALNDAFNVYSSALPYASRTAALGSLNSLVKKLKGNPTLLLQFTKAAEEHLYGPRASMWSDEAYIPFLEAIISEKKLPDTRKSRYAMQLETIRRCSIGKKFPEIRITGRNGRQKDYKPEKDYTLILFGNPECDDCRFSKTKLSMASDLEELVEEGKLEIMFIVADAMPEDQPELLEQFATYPAIWTPCISYGADDIFDIRATPSFYVIGKKGEILAKNIDVSQAIDKIRDLVEADAQKNNKKQKR